MKRKRKAMSKEMKMVVSDDPLTCSSPKDDNDDESVRRTLSNRTRLVERRATKRTREARESSSVRPRPLIDIGGPTDPSLLDTYNLHIASKIWSGDDSRLPLDVHNRAPTLKKWPLDKECKFVRDVVELAGLTTLATHTHSIVDRALITAFSERYYPETNTVHLPFGEMTIGPDDVHNILGIRMEGQPMSGRFGVSTTIPKEEAKQLVHELLGVSLSVAEKEVKRTHTLRLSWLRKNFIGCKDSDPDDKKRFTARAYMLYLLGCTLIPNKTGDKIPVYYLQSLVDLGSVGKISWGSGCLAHLLRELGIASRCETVQIAGCMSLLQTWIYEHFPSLGRCGAIVDYDESMPRICKWKPSPSNTDIKITSRVIREQLDDLRVDDVIWDPYSNRREHSPLSDISFYMGLMVCHELAEPYYADRILRQFGLVQGVPVQPMRPRFARTGSCGADYKCVYNLSDWHWVNWQIHVLPEKQRNQPVRFPGQCHEGYIEWFHSVTHVRVQNSDSRVRQIRRPAIGAPATGKFSLRLRYIADLLRCRGAGDRPLSPTSRLALAADLIDSYDTQDDLSEFGEGMNDDGVIGGDGNGAGNTVSGVGVADGGGRVSEGGGEGDGNGAGDAVSEGDVADGTGRGRLPVFGPLPSPKPIQRKRTKRVRM